MKKYIAALLVLTLLLSGCSGQKPSEEKAPAEVTAAATLEPENTEADFDESEAVTVSCSGTTVQINGSGVTAKDGIVTVSDGGTYILDGSLEGSVLVDAKGEEVHLVLNGIAVSCTDGPAIYVRKAENVILTLAEGTENALSDGAEYASTGEESEANACLYSKSDLVINGQGSLSVIGSFNHGIHCKDALSITEGDIHVDAVNDGIKGKDSIRILAADLTIRAGGDGLQSSQDQDETLGFISIDGGRFDIQAGSDGIQAETDLSISGGEYSITTQKSSAENDSFKGLKAGNSLQISDGTFLLNTEDDAIHSNGTVAISGGSFRIESGDDGVHADTSLEISGGDLDIQRSYEGLEAEEVLISGGQIRVVASDDGVNAANGSGSFGGFGGFGAGSSSVFLHITGGSLIVQADGDGLDSNGAFQLDGGTVIISGPENAGNGALDYDSMGAVNGGTLLAVGAVGMAQNFNSGTQCAFSAVLNGTAPAGTELVISDASGRELIRYSPTHAYQSVVFTSSELKVGETYTITAGAYSAQVQQTDTITGSGGGMFGGHGMQGGRGERPDGGREAGFGGDMPMGPGGFGGGAPMNPGGFGGDTPPDGFDGAPMGPGGFGGEKPDSPPNM